MRLDLPASEQYEEFNATFLRPPYPNLRIG